MAWVEQTNRRSQKAKHYYDADTGKYRADFTIHDQHYHDGAAWQDVDETLVDDGAGGFTKKNDKTRHQFRVASGGAYRWYPRRNVPTEYVDITEIQYYSNRWRTLNLPAAVWKAQSAEWDMTNLYASITNTWKRIKTEFILKNSSAYTRLRFAVAFTGLTYSHSTGSLTSTTDGLVWGRIDKPTAVDANGADVTVTDTFDGTWIEWEANTTGATFPITIDPTFTDGYGGDVATSKDTRVNSAFPARNYGTNTALMTESEHKGLIEFDLSSIAATATCDSATMSVYRAVQSTALSFTITAYSIASGNADWPEGNDNGTDGGAGDSCWNYKDQSPGSETAWAGSAGLSTSGTDYEASSIGSVSGNRSDVVGTEYQISLNTTRVAGWFGASNTNYGVLLTCGVVLQAIASSDHATTGYRPKLVVVYTAGDLTVQDVAHAHATGTVALTQVPTLISANLAHAHTTDALLITQVHGLVIADASHAHSLDSTVVSLAIDLVVADVSHAHTLDAALLTQAHSLVSSDLAHSNDLDVASLTQVHTLAAADLAHAHSLDVVLLTQIHSLTVSDLDHANTLDALVITQTHVLTAADTAHAHALDVVTLTQVHVLAVDDVDHAHSLDAVSLAQTHILIAADLDHVHALDATVLTQVHNLTVADIAHAHTTESVILQAEGYLVVQYIDHAHTLDAVSLTQVHVLTVADASHAHSLDAAAITVSTSLTAADVSHAHMLDAVTVSLGLAVFDVSHTQTLDAVTLTQIHVLTAADADHAHSLDNVTLATTTDLVTTDIDHAHTLDSVIVAEAGLEIIQWIFKGHERAINKEMSVP